MLVILLVALWMSRRRDNHSSRVMQVATRMEARLADIRVSPGVEKPEAIVASNYAPRVWGRCNGWCGGTDVPLSTIVGADGVEELTCMECGGRGAAAVGKVKLIFGDLPPMEGADEIDTGSCRPVVDDDPRLAYGEVLLVERARLHFTSDRLNHPNQHLLNANIQRWMLQWTSAQGWDAQMQMRIPRLSAMALLPSAMEIQVKYMMGSSIVRERYNMFRGESLVASLARRLIPAWLNVGIEPPPSLALGWAEAPAGLPASSELAKFRA
jgi:hypothetical protein